MTKNMQSAIHDRFVSLQIACIGPYDNKVEKREFDKIIAKIAKATMVDKKCGAVVPLKVPRGPQVGGSFAVLHSTPHSLYS